jgi:RNase H-fold protein (predicted Holliday junction resolvase)
MARGVFLGDPDLTYVQATEAFAEAAMEAAKAKAEEVAVQAATMADLQA